MAPNFNIAVAGGGIPAWKLTILGHLPTRVGWVFEIGITKQIAALRIASCIGNERQKNKASQKIPGQDHCENCYVMLFSAKIGHFLDMAITICSPKPAIHALESGFCLKWGAKCLSTTTAALSQRFS
jgi:hypothetical protein